MCEREYTGCPDCNGRAEEHIRHRVEQAETINYRVDADGHTDYDQEPEYGEPFEQHSEFVCTACGWQGATLCMGCVDEDCGCAECDPEQVICDPPEPDNIVLLRRTQHSSRFDSTDLPPELAKLCADRTLTYLPVRAERAADIYEEHLSAPTIFSPPVVVDLETPVQPWMLDTMIPEEAAA